MDLIPLPVTFSSQRLIHPPLDFTPVTRRKRRFVGSNLSEVLPFYMIPAYVEFLERIPLTANGKVDRQALPVPGAGGGSGAYETPANEIEGKRPDE